ncbi:hypothetical protein [Paenibacillus mendelii]|uniref:Uncharacterized protein n=1 Tax=Paenibacillus mendelii TaxID=206163 RepID=A0ABV6JIV4_9BACL|nr:hypothetical protein [Paenibacillus mendelii]MCQ6558770.1 hypothetical protein [Paenibacillus mendelii]
MRAFDAQWVLELGRGKRMFIREYATSVYSALWNFEACSLLSSRRIWQAN